MLYAIVLKRFTIGGNIEISVKNGAIDQLVGVTSLRNLAVWVRIPLALLWVRKEPDIVFGLIHLKVGKYGIARWVNGGANLLKNSLQRLLTG